jgi:predicted enzyme related to lactoylglutathione lyase
MPRMLVNIDVDDIEKAIRFYTEGLSLRVGRRLDATWVELVGADVPIYLLGAEAGTTPFACAKTAREYGRHWTPVHLDFAIDDLEVGIARAEAAGAKSEAPISDHVWGRMALLSDPFGNGFCLLQFKGRGYDEVAAASR